MAGQKLIVFRPVEKTDRIPEHPEYILGDEEITVPSGEGALTKLVAEHLFDFNVNVDEIYLVSSKDAGEPTWLTYNGEVLGTVEHREIEVPTAKQWIDSIRAAMASGELDKASSVLDNPPDCLKDLDKVGVTHLIMPDAKHVTEEMLDAPRRVMLYTDVMDNHNSEAIRKMLLAEEHYGRHLPDWFMKMEGHMTKADRLHLIYNQIIAGYVDPRPDRKPLKEHSRERQRWTLSIYLVGHDTRLTISRVYQARTDSGDKKTMVMDVKINRHELPEDWKKVFRKEAIDMSLAFDKGDDGIYRIKRSVIQLGTRADFAGRLTYDLSDGHEIYKNGTSSSIANS